MPRFVAECAFSCDSAPFVSINMHIIGTSQAGFVTCHVSTADRIIMSFPLLEAYSCPLSTRTKISWILLSQHERGIAGIPISVSRRDGWRYGCFSAAAGSVCRSALGNVQRQGGGNEICQTFPRFARCPIVPHGVRLERQDKPCGRFTASKFAPLTPAYSR